MLCVSFRYLNIHICNARIIIVVAVVDMRHFRFAESSVCQSIWHIQLVAFLLSGRVIRARFYSRSLASVDRCRIANVLSGTIGLQLNRCNCDIRKVKSLFWTYQNPLSDCRMSQDCLLFRRFEVLFLSQTAAWAGLQFTHENYLLHIGNR